MRAFKHSESDGGFRQLPGELLKPAACRIHALGQRSFIAFGRCKLLTQMRVLATQRMTERSDLRNLAFEGIKFVNHGADYKFIKRIASRDKPCF